jgi:hypothetical protein
MSQLETVLDEHDALPVVPLPPLSDSLPAGHLTDSRNFKGQAIRWGIDPEACDFFKEDLVYLYYGGLFFRRSERPTRKASMYPVGFLFQPRILADIDCYYPFDTGALARGYYGVSGDIVDHWRDCRITGRNDAHQPRRLVQYLFATNRKYIRGLASLSFAILPDPLPWLIRFLREDLTSLGADQRQYRIECQSKKPVSFNDLLWVGYPDVYAQWFARIFERAGDRRPDRWAYDTYSSSRPAEMAAVLQQEALTFIRGSVDNTL